MKKLLALTAFALCFGVATPVMANDHESMPKKEEWTGLSKEEKLKIIEERREQRIKKMDEKWDKMSDDEKIKFVEERHEKRKERREERREDRREGKKGE